MGRPIPIAITGDRTNGYQRCSTRDARAHSQNAWKGIEPGIGHPAFRLLQWGQETSSEVCCREPVASPALGEAPRAQNPGGALPPALFQPRLKTADCPLFVEQLLAMLVGIADTLMVSYAG